MHYTKLHVQCSPEYAEILMAELAEIGFDTFLENETGFEAYAEEEKYDQNALNDLKERYGRVTPLVFTFEKIEKRNWNEDWEKSYKPIIVDDRCLIRAEFHRVEKQFPYVITITPKMSFGTGHHQTTYLMIKSQMDIDHKNKVVMDAGCGTAILSIMASRLGASRVEAFDIDEWSVINGKENIEINGCENIQIQQGTITEVNLKVNFDIILANINKNVLLDEIKLYSACLNNSGFLLISGFYTTDIEDLLSEASQHNLVKVKTDERETWASLLLKKQG